MDWVPDPVDVEWHPPLTGVSAGVAGNVEWRGARPSYIVEAFATSFTEKPRLDYHLSRSFRFGPLLAQAAFNTIRFNDYRMKKDLVAHAVEQRTKIIFYTGRAVLTATDNDLGASHQGPGMGLRQWRA